MLLHVNHNCRNGETTKMLVVAFVRFLLVSVCLPRKRPRGGWGGDARAREPSLPMLVAFCAGSVFVQIIQCGCRFWQTRSRARGRLFRGWLVASSCSKKSAG